MGRDGNSVFISHSGRGREMKWDRETQMGREIKCDGKLRSSVDRTGRGRGWDGTRMGLMNGVQGWLYAWNPTGITVGFHVLRNAENCEKDLAANLCNGACLQFAR